MLSCDYNGWTDAPEDEREGLDLYLSEATGRDVLAAAPGLQDRPCLRGVAPAATFSTGR